MITTEYLKSLKPKTISNYLIFITENNYDRPSEEHMALNSAHLSCNFN